MNDSKTTKCTYCGGGKIVHRVGVVQAPMCQAVGLLHRSTFLGAPGCDRMLADLCEECGTVVRMYVDEVGKKWEQLE